MQQLTIEHNNTTTNQVVKNTVKMKNRREGKGHVLAISRRIYRLQRTDSFYVESESSDNNYYLVKFKRNVLESSWYCSCKDNSIRGLKCKHLFAIEFAIKWGTVKDIDKLSSAAKRYPTLVTKSYKDDDYTF